MVPHGVICNVVFVVFWGTLLRPTAGAVVLIRKFTTAKRSLATCEHTGGVLRDSSATSAANIAYIGRRNCLVTEAANSPFAAAGPKLSITRNPIAKLASD